MEDVRRRLVTASAALAAAGVDYAVVGGNAVAAWVATIDEGAVRNTRDVDILIRRADLESAKTALQTAGIDFFLDDINASARQAVHIVFADELVRPDEPAANPGVDQSTDFGAFRVINLEALVQIKLTALRDKDRTHLRDMIEVGLIDKTWPSRLPDALAQRLQSLLDTPNG